jgi:hypothetical protein
MRVLLNENDEIISKLKAAERESCGRMTFCMQLFWGRLRGAKKVTAGACHLGEAWPVRIIHLKRTSL